MISNSTSGYILKKRESRIQTDMCIPVFVALKSLGQQGDQTSQS